MIEFEGERYHDDRLFVFRAFPCHIDLDGDMTVTTSVYHDGTEPPHKWALMTYRNTERYPIFRIDHFDTETEALDYARSVEPTVPRISLAGRAPDAPMNSDAFAIWKRLENLRDPYPPAANGQGEGRVELVLQTFEQFMVHSRITFAPEVREKLAERLGWAGTTDDVVEAGTTTE